MPSPAASWSGDGPAPAGHSCRAWIDSGDARLATATRALIDGSWQTGGTIYLSAVTAWEIAVLVDAGHIELDLPAEAHGSSGFSIVPASRPCRSATVPPAAPTSCITSSTAIRPIDF